MIFFDVCSVFVLTWFPPLISFLFTNFFSFSLSLSLPGSYTFLTAYLSPSLQVSSTN